MDSCFSLATCQRRADAKRILEDLEGPWPATSGQDGRVGIMVDHWPLGWQWGGSPRLCPLIMSPLYM